MTVQERFMRYCRFFTTSSEESETVPSTSGQKVLGQAIVEELNQIGMQDAHMDENGYVYAFLAATPDRENQERIAFISHLDTAPDAPGENVQPKIIRYEGGDIILENGTVTSAAKFPCLQKYIGEELIVSDGSTLLGADDKAGVAEIVSLCAYLTSHPERSHRAIAVCFTPDEEIGSGADLLDLDKLCAAWGYTVDGGELGEIEYENFNAASAKWEINGVNIHPGEAKNRMKNAVLLANKLISMLPEAETPAHTEGYEGFYHVSDITACESHASVAMIVRDHDREKFEARKKFLQNLTAYLNEVYGKGTFNLTLADSYYNMKEKILPYMHIVDSAKSAMENAGITPIVVAIRGGTDGARLSFRGLPCPNLSTGGINFHSVHEFIPVKALDKMVEVLLNLV